MKPTILTTIALTGFGIAFFHAAIPTHWLPFVLAAKAQRWTKIKTLWITAIAGAGHVTFTAALGALVAWFGIALTAQLGALFPWLAGAILFTIGGYYLCREMFGRRHTHPHFEREPHLQQQHHISENHTAPRVPPAKTSDRGAITGLVALLTFSPCEAFLPVYVSAARYGWVGFAVLTIVLSVATVAGMVVFTSLTLAGVEKLKFGFIEQHENAITGALLCVVAILVVLFE